MLKREKIPSKKNNLQSDIESILVIESIKDCGTSASLNYSL